MAGLVEFHATHKLLLLAYNQAALQKLGRIVANPRNVRFPVCLMSINRFFPLPCQSRPNTPVRLMSCSMRSVISQEN